MNRGAKNSHYYKSSDKKVPPNFWRTLFWKSFIQILTADEKLFATAASSV